MPRQQSTTDNCPIHIQLLSMLRCENACNIIKRTSNNVSWLPTKAEKLGKTTKIIQNTIVIKTTKSKAQNHRKKSVSTKTTLDD